MLHQFLMQQLFTKYSQTFTLTPLTEKQKRSWLPTVDIFNKQYKNVVTLFNCVQNCFAL